MSVQSRFNVQLQRCYKTIEGRSTILPKDNLSDDVLLHVDVSDPGRDHCCGERNNEMFDLRMNVKIRKTLYYYVLIW